MATITKDKTLTAEDIIASQPYILLLMNDDFNTFDHVIQTLIEVCHHTYEQASQCALIVHTKGKCDVKRGDYETIIDMYEKICSRNISAEIEVA